MGLAHIPKSTRSYLRYVEPPPPLQKLQGGRVFVLVSQVRTISAYGEYGKTYMRERHIPGGICLFCS